MRSISVCLATLLLTATPALAQQFLISQPVGGDNFGARTTPKKDRRSSGRNWRDYTVGEDEDGNEGGAPDFDDDDGEE